MTGLTSEEKCKQCPKGKFCVDGRISGDCEAGYFCESGNFEPTPEGGSSGGYPCNPGFYCEVGTTTKKECPFGKFRVS